MKEAKIKTSENKKFIILSAVTVAIVTVMVLFSVLFKNKEIIFPEIAAISVGAFIAPKFKWKTSYFRMVLFITICAISGIMIVRFVPLDKPVQLLIAFILGQLIFLFSGTSFAPMISAIVLPVMLGTESMVYLVAAFSLTLVIVLVRALTDRLGLTECEKFEAVERNVKYEVLTFVYRTVIMLVLCYFGYLFKMNFIIAPPLLVLFTELSGVRKEGEINPVKVVGSVFLCAVAGAFSRVLICNYMHLPLYVAAFAVGILMIVILRNFKAFLPPAGALGVLALLIDEKSVYTYPLQILAGVAIYVAAVLALQFILKVRRIILSYQ
ncbi:MAG: hypothetical protein K6G11_08035 [Lachnospiraceae bacterium]|nr:hypothetical protein [Lachnospiraceae bacterium]